jgi:predicted dehydrogenase
MRAAGELGTLEWDGIRGEVTLARTDEKANMFRLAQTRDEMFLAQDVAFIEACRGNPDLRLATCEDGERALAICDAARLAARNRREEEINYH